MRPFHAFAISLLVLNACAADPVDDPPPDGEPDASVDPAPSDDPLEGLPTGAASWQVLCARGYGDRVSQAFCGGAAPPVLRSLADLRQLVGLELDADPSNPTVRFTMLGHSTAIGGRHVTPLNPRAFLFDRPSGSGPDGDYAVLTFTRGEPMVELVASDPGAGGALRFFLVRFELPCQASAAGCGNADLYGPGIESGWTGYSIYDDDAVGNTVLDCKQCHQPEGPGTEKILRMQELEGPWAHWFYEENPQDLATMQDYFAIRAGEAYAGIPAERVQPSRPIALQRLLTDNGFGEQRNAFDSAQIASELQAQGRSPTWEAIYAEAVAGRAMPVPYYGIPQTDATRVAAAIAGYRDVMEGRAPADQMPDPSDVLLGSALDEMSFEPAPGLGGREILVQMCQHCHNSRLDQTISRARFDVEQLDSLDRAVKDEAIRRLELGSGDRRKMPPQRFHTLSDAQRQRAIDELAR